MEEFLPKKRIAAISTMGNRRVIALSAMLDGVLAVMQMEELSGPFSRWRKTLAERCNSFHEKGLSVYIEAENIDYFSDFGEVISLDQMDEVERRTYQNIALDKYYDLLSLGDNANGLRGCLRLNNELQRHWISDNTVNVKYDDKGRRVYDVAEDSFTPHQRALLISVLGATHLNQFDEEYGQALVSMITEKKVDTPKDRMRRIFEGI